MKLYKGFATVGGMTIISRVLGFVRDILIALLLGTGPVADAFVVAFRFPNLFRRIFAEGAFNSAFVPLFAKRLEEGGLSKARVFAEEAMAMLVMALMVLLVIAELSMPWLMYIIAPGFSDTPEKFNLSILLTRITFPYLLFVSVVALFSGILNALGRFAAAAFAPVLLNVVLIAVMSVALLFTAEDQQLAGIYLCWGVFWAGVIQLLMLLFFLRKEGVEIQFRVPRFTPQMSELVKLGIPGILAGGVTQINILVGTIIASQQDGAVSYLYYADRIYQLPLGIVGIAIGVVLLPDLSRRLRAGDHAAVQESQNRSLEFSLFLTLPASIALFIASEPIIRVLFERGAFTAEDTRAAAVALSAFAWGLPSFVLIKVFSPVFFAREDTKTPMIYASVGMLANMLISLVLFWFIGHVGIAIATTISGWITAGLLWRKLVKLDIFEIDQKLKASTFPIILSSVIMGSLLWFGLFYFDALFAAQQTFIIQVFALMGLVCIGLFAYLTAIHFSGAFSVPKLIRMALGR